MSAASSVGSSVGSSVASSVARTAGGFDSDALAYFAAVEAAGGSFDLTGVNAAYTSSYVKQAHSDLFAGLKTDSLWSKITELYLLSGKTYAGMAIKAKGTGTLTLTNFVSGDYVSAGSGAGLKGDGSTKNLVTNHTSAAGAFSALSFGVYCTDAFNASTMGCRNASFTWQVSSAMGLHIHFGNPGRLDHPDPDPTNGFFYGTCEAARTEIYHNGTSKAQSGAGTYTGGGSEVWDMFSNGTAETSTSRLTLGFVGTTITDTDAANLSSRVNAFMTALGANVY